MRVSTLVTPLSGHGKFALAATCQMMIGEILGEKGREFLQWGLEDLKAYGRYAYDSEDNTFVAVATDGTRILPKDVRRDGYYRGKGRFPYMKPAKADHAFFRAYATAWRLSGDDFFWMMARSIAQDNGPNGWRAVEVAICIQRRALPSVLLVGVRVADRQPDGAQVERLDQSTHQ